MPIEPYDVLGERLGLPRERIVKLDANENPYGPSPRAQAVLMGTLDWHIYPDPESRALRRALAEYTGLPAGMLIAGAGADELLDILGRLFLAPGDVAVDCPPSFGMYPFVAAVSAGHVRRVPRLPDFTLDMAGIEAGVAEEPQAKLLFVCSPNNPDGSIVSDHALRQLLALPVIVVLDEAYIEFAGGSRIDWVREYDNLVVLRTFSKWAGLAGLRVGYGAFPEWIAAQAWKIKQPYNVNVAASAAAVASVQDRGYLLANVARLIAERARLIERLGAFEWLQPYPTQANFVLVRVLGLEARQLKHDLEQRGILVRYFDKPGLRDHLRISVGRPQDTDALVAALRRIEEERQLPGHEEREDRM